MHSPLIFFGGESRLVFLGIKGDGTGLRLRPRQANFTDF